MKNESVIMPGSKHRTMSVGRWRGKIFKTLSLRANNRNAPNFISFLREIVLNSTPRFHLDFLFNFRQPSSAHETLSLSRTPLELSLSLVSKNEK
jgi:hypothetical protein